MDFGALPPEINSGRMYAGPGPGSMLAAATAWQSLADELTSAAAGYRSIVSTLSGGAWTGPSSTAMAAAAAPYVTWLSATGDQAQQTAAQAAAAASAYETAFAATVPPPLIEANRSLLAALVATNVLGQNTPAIAAAEALYGEMWAQDAAAMYGYAGASSTASQVTPFTTPPKTTNSSGPLSQSAAAAQSVGTASGTDVETLMSSGPQAISGMPQALQSLASPQSLDSVASTATATGTSSSSTSAMSMLNELSTPLRLASMPMSMLSKLFTAGSTATAAKAATTAANELGAAHAVGLASSPAALGSTGFGAGAPALSAGMGRATSIGPLSVPSAWTGAAPSAFPAGTAMHLGATSAIPAAPAAAHSALPPMMPVANMGGQKGAGTPTRFELRSTVIPFTPAAG
ncbi:PPE family protein [Mycobacterium cookii]|nr:PPE family protein [Mycobacterium cookii]MCV7331202.1 PPE family protein [Mycobacterium cookii]